MNSSGSEQIERTAVAPGDVGGLATRLRNVQVALRDDLETTRHLFRGEPAYVIRDPLTFQSHRLDPRDYEVLVRISPSRTLGANFDELVATSRLKQGDEEAFYRFVLSLHRLGFLNLPVSDEKLLYRRAQMRQSARVRQRWLGWLFLRIPVWNPDAFLGRTLHLARPIFSRWFLLVWLTLLTVAGYVAVQRWQDLREPLNGLLAARNLPLIWLTLIVLKVLHEFGHAYACRLLGGHVPEMGVYLILGTPCAYVDASASWGFPRRIHRVIVCLAGMYVELAIAALAVIVWAATSPSLLNAVAYNVIFLAGSVTVLFNINPLMRYDGYYILSDLLEIPNLRQRSTQCLIAALKRIALGLRVAEPPADPRLRATLLAFGALSLLYRALVLIGIVVVIALKLPIVGWTIGCLYAGGMALRSGRRLTRYLWCGPETAPVRSRAIAVSVLLLLGAPLAVFAIPLRTNVYAAAVLTPGVETVVRASVPGILRGIDVLPGDRVTAGQALAELENDVLLGEVDESRSRVDAARIRRDAYLAASPSRASQEAQRLSAHECDLRQRSREAEQLRVRAPRDGVLVEMIRETDLGRFLDAGALLATIGGDGWTARAILTEDELVAALPRVGDAAEFRSAALGTRSLRGRIEAIRPLGSRQVEWTALTLRGGGSIATETGNDAAAQPFFEITVSIPAEATAGDAASGDDLSTALRAGLAGQVRLAAARESLARHVFRRMLRFANLLERE
jgi:putative peptide zinc metalloprotease protein